MRMIAFAALVTLLFAPSSLLDPSFQLSFGAVMALIAVFEKHELKLFRLFMNAGVIGKFRLYLIASVLTSIVASAATAPVILYHFQQVNWYGVITNLIAVPLSSFIIMPAAVAAVLAMPFGLEAWPLWAMRLGVHWMLESAAFVARLPGSVSYHPAMPAYALPLITFGGLWLCLWRKAWRFFGLLPLLLGTLSFLITPRPDVLVADDAVTVAARLDDGRLVVRAKDLEDFNVQAWVQRDGYARDNREHIVSWFDLAEAGGQGPLSCTGYDCVYTRKGKKIGFPMSADATAALCSQVDAMVTPFAVVPCTAKPLINAAVTQAQGAVSMRISSDGQMIIRNAKPATENRPWD
jgi:competence protein ComEC